MQNDLSLIHGSVLFAGTTVQETEKMLTCLSAKQAVYQKNEYILRAGDKNSCVMLLLEGGVCIVQEDSGATGILSLKLRRAKYLRRRLLVCRARVWAYPSRRK